MKRTRGLCVLLGWLLILGALAGCGGERASDQPPQGEPAAARESAGGEEPSGGGEDAGLSLGDFTAGTLDGGSFTQEDIAGRDATVINFWSLTCAPCISEMPDLAAYERALPDNVGLITVCLDGWGNEAYAQQILDQAGFEGVTLISGDGGLARLCGELLYTPTTVFVDSRGALVGDALVGGQRDLFEAYTAAVNQVLEAGGKAAISVEAE